MRTEVSMQHGTNLDVPKSIFSRTVETSFHRARSVSAQNEDRKGYIKECHKLIRKLLQEVSYGGRNDVLRTELPPAAAGLP